MSYSPLGEQAGGKRRQPSVAVPPAEGPPRKRKLRQRGKKKAKKADSDGWQEPVKTATPQVAQKSQPVESRNPYEVLAEEPTPETAEVGLNPPEKDQAPDSYRKEVDAAA